MQLSNMNSNESEESKDFFCRCDSAEQKERQTKQSPAVLQSAGQSSPGINIKLVSGIIVLMHL